MSNNVTMATIAKRVREKNTPSAKRFVVICVVLILSIILLVASVSMMLETAWANDGEILTENVATTETMAEPAPAFDDESIESVEESEPEAPVQAIEPVEEAANYIGTDEIRCYMSEFQYPEQRELVHRICKEFDVDAELTVFPPYEPKPVTVEAITGVIKEALVDCDLLTVKAKTAVWVVYHWLAINSIPLSVMSAFEKELSQDPEYDWLSPERTFSIVQYLSDQVLYLLQMASVAEYRDANIPKKAVARAMQKCGIEHDVDTIRDIVALYVTGGEKLLQTERYNCGIGDDFDEWVPIVKRLVAAMTA